MSTIPTVTDSYSEYDRTYVSQMLESDIFGAILTAIRYRKANSALTQTEIARRCGKRKEQISVMMSGPSNIEIGTIAVIANALDLEFRYAFIDRISGSVAFNGTGVHQIGGRVDFDRLLMPAPPASQWSMRSSQTQVWGVRSVESTETEMVLTLGIASNSLGARTSNQRVLK